MKRYYFIDFDSVKELNAKEENFDCKSYLYLFYYNTNNPRRIDLDHLQLFNRYAKKTEFIKVPDEKHLLGKYLCAKLGEILDEKNEFVIITAKDSYHSLAKYYQEQGYHVSCKENFNKEDKPKKEVKKTEPKKEIKKPVKPEVKKEAKSKVEVKPEVQKEEKVVIEKKEEPIIQEVIQPVEKKEELVLEVKEAPVEKKEEVKNEPDKKLYTSLFFDIHNRLGRTVNANGNKYSARVKKDASNLIVDTLKQEQDLKVVYDKLQERYPITYKGIYEIARKCVLKSLKDVSDYVVIEEAPVKEETTTPVQEVVEEGIPEKEEVLSIQEETTTSVQEVVEEAIPEKEEALTVQEETTTPVQEEVEEGIPEKEEVLVQEVEELPVQEEVPVIAGDPIQTYLLNNTDEETVKTVMSIIEDGKQQPANKQKSYIYTTMSKTLGRTKATDLYREIKKML